MSKPVLVIVHGAWHTPQHYAAFANLLEARGFEVHTPHLPSSGSRAVQCSLADDVAVVRERLLALSNESKEIIVIAHSYGGVVATESVQDFSCQERKSRGLVGGVVHIVYMCAFMLQPGESALSASTPRPGPDPVDPFEDGTCFLSQPPIHLFYGDVKEDVAKQSESLLVRQNIASLTEPVTYPAWKHIPTTYVKCTEDQILLYDWQKNQIHAAREAGANIEAEEFIASHSPFLSVPEDIALVVVKISTKYD